MPKLSIEDIRRQQIIEAAIFCLAELGYGGTTLQRVAEKAGIQSASLISYHFNDKEELLFRCLIKVMEESTQAIEAAVSQEQTATKQLEAYIRSTIDFYARKTGYFKAVLEIVMGSRTPRGQLKYGLEEDSASLAIIENILSKGQDNKEFANLPIRPTALALRGALDTAIIHLQTWPEISADQHIQTLIHIYAKSLMITSKEHS